MQLANILILTDTHNVFKTILTKNKGGSTFSTNLKHTINQKMLNMKRANGRERWSDFLERDVQMTKKLHIENLPPCFSIYLARWIIPSSFTEPDRLYAAAMIDNHLFKYEISNIYSSSVQTHITSSPWQFPFSVTANVRAIIHY